MTNAESSLIVTSEMRLSEGDEAMQKLDKIKRLALAHNSPAVNIGAHRLAGLILEILAGK